MSLGLSAASTAAAALEGNLGELPLFELLGLLARSSQSGTVYFATSTGAAVTLADGELTFATADPALSLRELLLRRAVTSEAGWSAALDQRDLDIGVALVRSGANSIEIQQTVLEQIVATLHLAQSWHDVEFRFLTGSRKVIGPGLAISVEHARHLVDERTRAWDEMYDTIPSVDVAARLVAEPPVSDGLLTIDASDWPVLVAIDGHRTIAELAVPAQRSPFQAAQSVCRLARSGLAAVVPR